MTDISVDQFYSHKGKANQRLVRVGNVAARCSKAPTNEKRISVPMRMVLSGRSNKGAPEWLDSAYTYVAEHHQVVTPDIDLRGYELTFDTDNLFGDKCPIVNKCMLRAFEISEMGTEESTDVVCAFSALVPFSSKVWNWLGQHVGEEIWIKFVAVLDDQKDDKPPIAADDDAAEGETGEEDD